MNSDTYINYIPEWLTKFKEKHHRFPRVLHIGNIANNAYLNAKLLRKIGIECDVLSFDYYHIMGCPEWEEADFINTLKEFSPQWHLLGTGGFQRPRWFVQGFLKFTLKYLTALYSENKSKLDFYWLLLSIDNKTAKNHGFLKIFLFLTKLYNTFLRVTNMLLMEEITIENVVTKLLRLNLPFIKIPPCYFTGIMKYPITCILVFIKMLIYPLRFLFIVTNNTLKNKIQHLICEFQRIFSERLDRLTQNDLLAEFSYYYTSHLWEQLFKHYDLVHAYAEKGIIPLLLGKPYLAYEHGTIRNIPFTQTASGRALAITYKLADFVCITNADNVIAAKKLGLERFEYIPHPVNEDFSEYDEKAQELHQELQHDLKSDFIVFHPARHHWDENRHPDWDKGNDIFIYGFAEFIKNANPRAGAIFVEWGKTVNESKKLVKKLGITDRILWIQPQPHRQMIRYIYASQLVADQFVNGAFGSILPKALLCGRPAMIYINPAVHTWCFHELPPVINAKTSEEVFQGLKMVYSNTETVNKLVEQGKQWYRKYHSNQVIQKRLSGVYKNILTKTGRI